MELFQWMCPRNSSLVPFRKFLIPFFFGGSRFITAGEFVISKFERGIFLALFFHTGVVLFKIKLGLYLDEFRVTGAAEVRVAIHSVEKRNNNRSRATSIVAQIDDQIWGISPLHLLQHLRSRFEQ